MTTAQDHRVSALPLYAFFEHRGTLYRKHHEDAHDVFAEQCYPVPVAPLTVRFDPADRVGSAPAHLFAGYKLFHRLPEDIAAFAR